MYFRSLSARKIKRRKTPRVPYLEKGGPEWIRSKLKEK